MKSFRSSFLTMALSSLFASSVSHAAAFQLYELGTPVNGTAAVGQAAIASDASTSYFNPAGMAALTSTQGMIGSQIIQPHINFSANNTNTISGNNGGNAALLTPGLGLFYVYNYSPQLKLGVSFTSPYGGALEYYNHWVGRYNVQQMVFYTLNLNPAFSYQINNWLAVGAGAAFEYANLNQTVALRLTPLVDGQANIRVNNTAPGYNMGVILVPSNTTRLGIAYRSQIVHQLRGNLDFLNLSVTPSVTTKMVMPANVIVSLSEGINEQLSLLAELGWTNWSSMVNNIVTVDGFSATTPQNWNNTYRAGLGAQYKCLIPLMLQVGISYDSSPTSSSKRLPDLPMDRQVRAGAGMEYTVTRGVTLGASYEYINFGKAAINNVSSIGVLSGSYTRNYANVIQASLNVAV